MHTLTNEQLLELAWQTRYASDEAGVNQHNAAVDELVERGYSEPD
jgi:predicted Ser/Thr protein kinase